jgi:hypothetical protein
MGSKATAVRRRLRLRGRNSDAATTTASVGVVITRLEEEAANMTNGSISDSSPLNKQSTVRNSFASTIAEDIVSISSLPDTSNTITSTTATTGLARQVVASATSGTAKRLSFFRTRSPSNVTDKTNNPTSSNPLLPSSLSSSTTSSTSSSNATNTTTTTTTTNGSSHPLTTEMPPSPNITSSMALTMSTANTAAIITSPHIYQQQHQQQHQRSHSAAASVTANHEGTNITTSGTRRRFLFGRSTPFNATTTTNNNTSINTNNILHETMMDSVQSTVNTHRTSRSATASTDNVVATKNLPSNTSLPSLVSAQ